MTDTKLLIKRSIKSAAAMARSRMPRRSRSSEDVNIIAYHRVVADIEKAEDESYYGLVVSTSTFREHCELLKQNYSVVSLEHAADVLKRKRRSHRPLAVITFDDGYLDFYEEAFPILKELGITATVFLPTTCIGQDQPLAHDRIFWLLRLASKNGIAVAAALERSGVSPSIARLFSSTSNLHVLTERLVYLPDNTREKVIAELEAVIPQFREYPREFRLLNWDQIREMSAAGIGFGGHTANHVVLPIESGFTAEFEIAKSKSELESQIKRAVTTFAYPNGEYDPAIRRLVSDAGFKVAVTTEKKFNRPGTDPLALGRFSLCEESTRGIRGMFSPKIAALRLGL